MMRAQKVAARAIAMALLGAALAGCGGEQEELQQWMEQQRREAKPNVEPLSAPKKFTPQVYLALAGVEPFSTQKLTVALKQETRQRAGFLLSSSVKACGCYLPHRGQSV